MALLTKNKPAPVVVEDDLPRHTDGRGKIIPIGKDGSPDLKAKLKLYSRWSKWGESIESREGLELWNKRTVLIGAGQLSDPALQELLATTRQLDPSERDDKKTLDELADKLIDAGGGYTKQRRGTHYHKLSEAMDRGEELPVATTPQERLDMARLKVSTMHLETRGIEQYVVHDELKACGRFDRLYFYDGPDPDGEPAGHLIGDLKTGNVAYGTIKNAAQIAGYSRSKLYDKETGVRTDMPADLNQRWGVIMHLVPGEDYCQVYWVDLTIGWMAVEHGAQQRALRRLARKVLRPFLMPQLANVSEPLEEEEEDE